MKVGGGKRKGGIFENKIYDDIRKKGLWVRKNKGSGNTIDNAGDLETEEYLIECKHYKKITNKDIIKWSFKIDDEAKRVKKYPLLICKENNKPVYVYYWKVSNKDNEMEVYNRIDYKLWLNLCLGSDKK